MKTKIMIVDDHRLIREGIKKLLEVYESIEVIDEASDGLECLRKLEYVNPDLLLLDINMPGGGGLDVLQKIKAYTKYKIIILTGQHDIKYLLQALDSGVDGYLLKNTNLSELKKAIDIVLSGKKYIQPSLVPNLKSEQLNKNMEYSKVDSLTKRELDVLHQVTAGMINKEIAMNLNISERTVKNHLSSIFRKLNVSDRTQAAIFAIRNNICEC